MDGDIEVPVGEAQFNPNEPAPEPQAPAQATQAEAPAGVQQGGRQPQGEAPAGQPASSLRDVIQGNLGYQFGQEVDGDWGALSHLVARANRAAELERQAQQQNVYTQLGQQLAPKARELGQFFQQQAAPPEPKAKPWEPPAFDERILPLLVQDEATGMFTSKPGVDPNFARQANERLEWQRNFQKNPTGVFDAYVQSKQGEMEARILEKVRAEQAQANEQATVYQIAQQNAGWFYQLDPSGQPMVIPGTNQYAVTQRGQEYLQYMQAIRQMGVTDPVNRDRLARALMGPGAQQAAPQAPGATYAQARALASSQDSQNPLQGRPILERQGTMGSTEPNLQGVSLRDRLKREFEAGGITDEVLMREFS